MPEGVSLGVFVGVSLGRFCGSLDLVVVGGLGFSLAMRLCSIRRERARCLFWISSSVEGVWTRRAWWFFLVWVVWVSSVWKGCLGVLCPFFL